jgi:flagellar M-ring protein FliF
MAETSENLPQAAAASVPAQPQPGFNNDMLTGLGGLSIVRQVALLIALAVSIGVGVAVALWSKEGSYRPLYGSLEALDSAQVLSVLDSHQIGYKLDGTSGALLVDSGRLHEARLKLAEAGMPSDRAMGFELLDQEQALGTSQFMETTRYRRGLEGELARTIASINSVRSARVHLAIPERSVFVRDQRKPSASVFLELFAGRSVKPAQVQAIGNLVASSIPELSLSQVTIVDQKGNLLSSFDSDSDMVAAGRQFDYTRKVEDDLIQRINRILEPVVGLDNFKAEVSADIDFTEVEQTDEIFNPDLPAIRSEQTLQESRAGSQLDGGVPGALSNQPPGVATVPEELVAQGPGVEAAAPAGNSRSQATRNYELDRTLSYTRHQVGKIRRLTVAVVVDDMKSQVAEGGEEGQAETTPWSENELARLAVLVRDAVGYDAARGDSVNVINARFLQREVEELEAIEQPFWEQSWFLDVLKLSGGIIAVLVLILGVLRPVMKNLSNSANQIKAFQERQQQLERERAQQNRHMAMAGAPGADVTLTGGETSALLPGPGQGYQQQLNMVRGLVDEDSGRVAQVVKRWVSDGE